MISPAAHFGNTTNPRNTTRCAPTATPPAPNDTYRRRARRLRRLYSQNPALLHRRLRQLSESQRPQTPRAVAAEPSVTRSPSLAANSPAAWYFAHRVAARLQGTLLSYSDRTTLLKEADRLGIKRFEANLIIAVTQHRHRTSPLPQSLPAPAAHSSPLPRWLLPTTLALTLQAALLALLYHVLF